MPRGGTRTGAGRKKGASAHTKLVRAKLQATRELNAEATKEQIRRGMEWDIRALFDERGNIRPIHTLTAEEAMPIAGFEIVKRNLTSGDGSTDMVLKIKLVDRSKYVEMAAKHHALLTEKVQVTVEDTLFNRLDQGRLRASSRTEK